VQALQSGLTNTLIDRESLSVLPNRTGGRVVVGANDPELSIREIFRESEAYYVIAVERAVSARPDAASTRVRSGAKGFAWSRNVSMSGISAPSRSRLARAACSRGRAEWITAKRHLPLALSVTAFSNTANASP
jgi:hypothetical protein